MKDDNKKGKRGRPRKTPAIMEKKVDGAENIIIKKGRGRPRKATSGDKVIIDKPMKDDVDVVIPDDYVPPKIQRKKRVFIFEKKVFHAFANKYKGDIVVMSYVFDNLMRMYINKKINLPVIDEDIWWKFERSCTTHYTQFIGNSLLKTFMDETNKINIDVTKANLWCII